MKLSMGLHGFNNLRDCQLKRNFVTDQIIWRTAKFADNFPREDVIRSLC